MARIPTHRAGFTLIELMVVITLIGLLVTLAAPRYFDSVDRGRKTVQQQNIQTIRDSIDKFYADRGRYPEALEELVRLRYLRDMPIDPVTRKSDWLIVPPPDGAMPGASAGVAQVALGDEAATSPNRAPGNVYDVRSAADVPQQ
ncbi:type II secretion system protein [Ramlibacter sp. MMS24-I3-19]|uniref:type II secretion system protein n=1 Tax=Ramlibacter sp. MMS24-I3-19 TaxID=3416606 RepID=UPI003CFE5CBA